VGEGEQETKGKKQDLMLRKVVESSTRMVWSEGAAGKEAEAEAVGRWRGIFGGTTAAGIGIK